MDNVAVVIPHYGKQELLDKCIEHLPKGMAVYVVDDNKKKMGFTKAINIGLGTCLKASDELLIKTAKCLAVSPYDRWFSYILILNNDCYVQKNCIKNLVKRMKSDEKVGIVAPMNVIANEPDKIFWGGSLECFPWGQHKGGLVSLGHCNEPTYEHWATFSCVLIRHEIFEQIGLLDENMKFIFSDSDFCFRARAAGWKIVYEPKAVVHHEIGKSAGKESNPRIEKQKLLDQIYFGNKWLNGKLFFDLTKEIFSDLKST